MKSPKTLPNEPFKSSSLSPFKSERASYLTNASLLLPPLPCRRMRILETSQVGAASDLEWPFPSRPVPPAAGAQPRHLPDVWGWGGGPLWLSLSSLHVLIALIFVLKIGLKIKTGECYSVLSVLFLPL